MVKRGKIFISYRRSDVPGDARELCARLERRFGKSNVFMDVDALLAGQRFDRELEKALAQCNVLIAIIGPRWIESLAEQAREGQRDFVHDEIAAALKRDIIVIPVLVGRQGAMPTLPSKEDLPGDITDLILYQKHEIAHESFRRDADQLAVAIKAVLSAGRRPQSRWPIVAASGACASLALLLLAYKMDWPPWAYRTSPETRLTSVTDGPRLVADTGAKKEDAVAEKDRLQAQADAEAMRKRQSEVDAAKRKANEDAAAAKLQAEDEARKAADETAKRQAQTEAERKKAVEQAAASKAAADCDRLAASPFDMNRPKGTVGVEYLNIDAPAATAACELAVRSNPGEARFLFHSGRAAIARKDFVQAASLFQTAIVKGSIAAVSALGDLYYFGQGFSQNYSEARKLFERGSALGDPYAMASFGVLYEEGQGAKKDYARARELYERGASLNGTFAMVVLGSLYRDGHGVKQDYDQARKWYEKAVSLGSSEGMSAIGILYEDGLGVTQDYAEASKWYEKAAALGNRHATVRLGALYDDGLGFRQNYIEASRLYMKAISLEDDVEALVRLGTLYEDGRGVDLDRVEARRLFERAAGLGSAEAMNNLGRLYEPPAKQPLPGKGIAIDYGQARKWYAQSAQLGNADAMYSLGRLYEDGNGVQKDTKLARQWYEKATKGGNTDAAQRLKNLSPPNRDKLFQ